MCISSSPLRTVAQGSGIALSCVSGCLYATLSPFSHGRNSRGALPANRASSGLCLPPYRIAILEGGQGPWSGHYHTAHRAYPWLRGAVSGSGISWSFRRIRVRPRYSLHNGDCLLGATNHCYLPLPRFSGLSLLLSVFCVPVCSRSLNFDEYISCPSTHQ